MTTSHYVSMAPNSGVFKSYKPGILFLWDIGKQNSPRHDAAERGCPSGTILLANQIFIINLFEELMPLKMKVGSPK